MQAHGIEQGGTLDEIRTRLVYHFITNDCELDFGDTDLPRCRSEPRDSANLQSFLSSALDSKLSKRLLRRILVSVGIDHNGESVNKMRKHLRKMVMNCNAVRKFLRM